MPLVFIPNLFLCSDELLFPLKSVLIITSSLAEHRNYQQRQPHSSVGVASPIAVDELRVAVTNGNVDAVLKLLEQGDLSHHFLSPTLPFLFFLFFLILFLLSPFLFFLFSSSSSFFSSFIFSPSSFSPYPPHPLPSAKLLFLCLSLTLLLPFPPTFYTSVIFLLYDPHSSAILIYLYQSKLRFQNVLVYTCRYSVYTVQCSSETCKLQMNTFQMYLKRL